MHVHISFVEPREQTSNKHGMRDMGWNGQGIARRAGKGYCVHDGIHHMTCDGYRYRAAILQLGTPCITEKWIYTCWEKAERVSWQPFIIPILQGFKSVTTIIQSCNHSHTYVLSCLVMLCDIMSLHHMVCIDRISVTGITVDERDRVKSQVESHGGEYTPHLTRDCTHLIAQVSDVACHG